MSNAAISLKNVSKRYFLFSHPAQRLWMAATGRTGRSTRSFHALRNVDLDIRPGETWGIMGRNGSGKSTLLQLVAGTLHPTEGSITTSGRVAALLELGSGFNLDFTGRENVFFNGQIIGLTRDEIAARFEDIVAFAGIGDFLDQPVRMYSSGMVVRLAFAVLAHVDPEVLLVDEALAVGDASFQAKCMKRIRQLRESGTTILFVSHDQGSINMLCDHAALLEGGRILERGKPRDMSNLYTELISTEPSEASRFTRESDRADEGAPLKAARHGNRKALFESIRIEDPHGNEVQHLRTGEPFSIRITLLSNEDLQDLVVGISIRNLMGLIIYGSNTLLQDVTIAGKQESRLQVVFSLPCQLNRGVYTLSVALHTETGISYDWIDEVSVFEVDNESICDGIVDLAARVTVEPCTTEGREPECQAKEDT